MEAVSRQAVRICRLFGDNLTQRVTTSVGPEQEYFIVDRETYLKRKDLIFTGRTLFGAMPPKGLVAICTGTPPVSWVIGS